MKKYLLFLIPFCKWLTNYVVVAIIAIPYLLPQISKWLDLGVGLFLSFVIAMPFVYWAFHRMLPTRRELAVFLVSWVGFTIFFETLVTYLFYSDVSSLVVRYEFALQTLVEVLAVFFMLRVLRRHRAYHEAAEGIDLS